MKKIPIDEDALYFAVRAFVKNHVHGNKPESAVRAAIEEYIRMAMKGEG